MTHTSNANHLLLDITHKSEIESLEFFVNRFPKKVIFSTSLGYEDQVITDMIFKNDLDIKVFTLDTGRLFGETYTTLEETRKFYKKPIDVFFPKTHSVEELLTNKGAFSFYESVENRKECCYIRKVEPLKRALKSYTVWVTGIRKSQSGHRQDMKKIEWDNTNNIFKFHPLLDWSLDDVTTYIKDNHVPYNSLHDKGFVSIGCQPCTRAVGKDEDFRSGRWWWETQSKKECGLHT